MFTLSVERPSAYFVLPIDPSRGVTSFQVNKSDIKEEIVIYGAFRFMWPSENSHETVITFHRSSAKLIFYIKR
jgi:hypothetical protein